MMSDLTLLALSGSLRKDSYNTAAIHALAQLAPPQVEIQVGSIADLPLFNPDRENEQIAPLLALKNNLYRSSGLIIATPEYAHGISGPMKNALDWLVSGCEFPNLPIMLINTSPRAHHAQDALREVLTTMSGIIIESAFVNIPLLGSHLKTQDIVKNEVLSTALSEGLLQFCSSIRALKQTINE